MPCAMPTASSIPRARSCGAERSTQTHTKAMKDTMNDAMKDATKVTSTGPAEPSDASPEVTSTLAWWALMVLMLLALYTLADRPMLNLQVESLRKDLGLTDFQIGMVQGLSVALFTAFFGYPIAWLADRFDRRIVLAGSIAVWSTALALMGLARNFEELFIASAFVGAGEAGLVPISLAMIPELFRGAKRHLANSLMLLAARLGAGVIVAVCGWLLVSVDAWRGGLPEALQGLPAWRLALLVLALPGVLLVPLLLTLPRQARHPVAAALPGAPPSAQPGPPRAAVLPFLRANRPAFASFYAGVACMAFGVGCIMNFAPAVAMRQMAANPMQAGSGMGTAVFTATVIGFLIAQFGYRVFATRLGANLPAKALLASAILSAAMAAAMAFAHTPTQLFLGVGAFLTMVMAGTLLFPLALQDMTPSPVRGRLIAIAITLNIVVGAIGPAVVGAISDRLKGQPDGLLLAMTGSAVVALVISAVLLIPLLARYEATVVAARRQEER